MQGIVLSPTPLLSLLPLSFLAATPPAPLALLPRHSTALTPAYALAVAMSVCSLLSNRLELIGISGVWNGFFITASASGVSPPSLVPLWQSWLNGIHGRRE